MRVIGFSVPLSSGLRRMLDVLGEILDARFEERTVGDDAKIDAWLFPESDHEAQRRIMHYNCPCYAVIRSDQLVPCGRSSTIDFALHSEVLSVLSGRHITSDEAVKVMALPKWLKDVTVLASKAEAPIWAMQEIDGRQHHYVSSPIPELNEGEAIFQYFHGEQFLSLLPLFIFVRGLSEDKRWDKPDLRACFMFDDPNLHWRTYGFVDYEQIAAHAQLNSYHVCFATIPLDTWLVHKPTAALFRQYRDQLSLLIHGNNHISQELARPCGEEGLNRDLQQALRRIDEFERRSGVEVSTVMAPPHGACGEMALGLMAQLGFEAACISRGSLRHYNGEAAWLRTIGMKPSDMIGGLTVLPRFRISRTCHNSVLIAALLNQPIIPVGHHHDISDGLHLLGELAGYVNSLGTVRWGDMKRIVRSHYARRFDGQSLWVRMFTNRIEVCVPEGTDEIRVERPWVKDAESSLLAWKCLGEGSEWKPHHSNEPIPVQPFQKIEIVGVSPKWAVVAEKNLRRLCLWPIVRRQLTEARDRIVPFLR